MRTSTTCFFPARAFMSQPTCHMDWLSRACCAQLGEYETIVVQVLQCSNTTYRAPLVLPFAWYTKPW